MVAVGKALSDAYLSAGAPVVDFVDEVTGAVYVHAPLLSFGSATTDSHTHLLTLKAGARVVYSRIGGSNRAIVLGALPLSSVGQKFQAEVEPDPRADFPADRPTAGDVVLRHGGAVVVLATNGEIVIDTKESGQPVKVQLSGSGVLRVSRNGVEPEEHVLLAGPVRALLDEIIDRLNTVHTELNGLAHDAAKTLSPATVIAPPTAGAAVAAFIAAAKKRTLTLALLPELLATDQSLESSVVLLPVDSRSDTDIDVG